MTQEETFRQFQEQHRSLIDPLMAELSIFQPDPPHRLFHYTTAHGLLGILRSAKLWSTNVLYMNDFGELLYARALFSERIEEQRKDASPLAKAFLEGAQRAIDHLIDEFHVYAVCFSEEEDDLAQWREYAARGGGYAIAFSGLTLQFSLHVSAKEPIMLFKVLYDRYKQEEVVSRFLTMFSTAVESELSERSGEEQANGLDLFEQTFAGRVIPYLVSVKHPSFHVEKEWRAVTITPANQRGAVQFRPATGFIVPYKELQQTDGAAKLPIEGIVQGPHVKPDLGERALQLVLMENGYTPEVKIYNSGIPLRSL